MIWFTSDTHYNHKNIVRGTAEWENKQRCRNFDTLEEHNNKLVENFNRLVKPEDTLYHLGDWSFGGVNSIWEFRKQLVCKDIHLILGNHDHHIEKDKRITMPKEEFIKYDYLLAHDIIGSTAYVDLQQLFSSVQHYREISINKQQIILCHYGMRVWNRSHHGSWMLYGHSHGTLDHMTPKFTNPTWIGDNYFVKNYKTMDVGVDTNDLLPYSISELHDVMVRKEVLLDIDHHNTETN